jgi:hypothetical protein
VNLLGKALALIGSAVLLTLGLMFSLVLVAAVAVVGLALGAWFFWNTRHLRKAMRDAQDMRQPAPDGQVIEGEAVVVEEYRGSGQQILPEASREPPP